MNLIVSADRNWGIGKAGGMLFHMPGDLLYFKKMTTGKVVVMGRRTFESLPPAARPLPNRVNIVLSANPAFAPEGVTVCRTEEELLALLGQYDADDVFIIGGAGLYRRMMPLCSRAYITRVDAEAPADRFIPDFDNAPGWRLVSQSEPVSENGVTYRFCEYARL